MASVVTGWGGVAGAPPQATARTGSKRNEITDLPSQTTSAAIVRSYIYRLDLENPVKLSASVLATLCLAGAAATGCETLNEIRTPITTPAQVARAALVREAPCKGAREAGSAGPAAGRAGRSVPVLRNGLIIR
jgi:hypothetical protein